MRSYDAGARGKAVIGPDTWGDLRYLWLAQRLNLASAVEAVGYVAQLWAWQGAHHTDEAPAYVIPVEVVSTILDRRWPAALVRCGLARAAWCQDGARGVYLVGVEEHVRLATRDRRAASAGGRAVQERSRALRQALGR